MNSRGDCRSAQQRNPTSPAVAGHPTLCAVRTVLAARPPLPPAPSLGLPSAAMQLLAVQDEMAALLTQRLQVGLACIVI